MSQKYSIRKLSDNIPVSDPCAVLRAQDRYAPMVLAAYISVMEKHARSDYLTELKDILFEMVAWQALNPTKVKEPD